MSKQSEKSYKDLRAELDELLEKFETASHSDVDVMIEDYDNAMKLISQLEKKLAGASKKLKAD